MTRRRAFNLIIFCLLVAAALRLPELSHMPPGPHYDEAANGILAAEIGLRGERPLLIAGDKGQEVLFFYLAGGLMHLLSTSLFTLRLTSAFLALLTVAATYWLGRELLADRRVAVVATALLAISFWHLLLSRLGFRAIAQPLLQALAVAALFRGLKRDDARWLAAGGIFLGLTAYTYLAARLFPLPLALALLPLLAGQERHKRFFQIALFLGTGLLVLAPLLFYFFQHPAAFWIHVNQIAPTANPAGVFDSIGQSLGMLFLVGDPTWRFNLPGRPLFNWFWGGLLVIGWLLSLLRWRRWWYDWQKAAIILLLSVPFFMLFPSALPVDSLGPSNLRVIGLIPFVFYLPALGLVRLVEEVADHYRGRDEEGTRFLQALSLMERYNVNYTFVVLFVLMLGGSFTARQYFQEWGSSSQLFYASNGDLALAADYVDMVETPHLFVASRHYRHPTLAFASEQDEQVKWLLNGRALVLPPDGEALYVYPRSNPRPEWAVPYLAETPHTVGPLGPDGRPVFVAYTPAAEPPAPRQQGINFGNVINLSHYEVGSGRAGERLPLLLQWEVVAPPPDRATLFVHLEDGRGNRWSLAPTEGYLANEWAVGEQIIQQVQVPVPAGAPPGDYRLRAGFFEPATGARLPRLDEEGRYAGDSLLLEGARVRGGEPPAPLPAPPRGTRRMVQPGLALLGYSQEQAPVRTGETLPLALWWYAEESQPSLTVRLILARADNTGIILLDTRPVAGSYPFSDWQPPRFLIDKMNPQIPLDLEAGAYRLALRLLDQAGDTVYAGELGPVTVLATERTFELPGLRYPLAATFGGEIRLAGYDLAPAGADTHTLRLAWQALAVPGADYTVFVHLLAEDGSCCLWQEERMPRPEPPAPAPYPTGLWLPGEVIVESYQIELPPETAPGSYPLEVGLYLAASGRPLQVQVAELPESDILYLRPLTVE